MSGLYRLWSQRARRGPEACPEYGITIVADEYMETRTPTHSSADQKSAELTLRPSSTGRQDQPRSWQSKLEGPRHGFHSAFPEPRFANRKNIELAGKAAEGVLVPMARVNIGPLLPDTQPQKKVIMEYTQAMKPATKNRSPLLAACLGFDAPGHGRAQSGRSPIPLQIRDFIENTKVSSASTGFSISLPRIIVA